MLRAVSREHEGLLGGGGGSFPVPHVAGTGGGGLVVQEPRPHSGVHVFSTMVTIPT